MTNNNPFDDIPVEPESVNPFDLINDQDPEPIRTSAGGAFARAPDIHGGYDRNHKYDDSGRLRGREAGDFLKIGGKGMSESGDRGTGNNQEEAPAVEKRGETPEAIADVAVQAARFRVCGGKFSVSKRAQQGKNSTDKPDEE